MTGPNLPDLASSYADRGAASAVIATDIAVTRADMPSIYPNLGNNFQPEGFTPAQLDHLEKVARAVASSERTPS